MPYTDSGERVECILNALGVVNRLNSAQIFEISINFICSRVVEKIKTMTTLKEKEKLLFDIIKRFNPDQCKKLKEYYSDLKLKDKREFFQSVIDDGIYIHQHVFWEGEYIFDIIRKIYEDYDWIKPVDAYINKWGRKIKIMKPVIIGDLYMIKLKQSSKKGFSARSTGAISRKGVPEKSIRNKIHQDLYSSTPIRIGDQENTNATIGVPPEMIAQLHMHYRSSIAGRRNLGKDLLSNMKKLKSFSDDDKVTNRNVEILQAYLKAMGYRIEFFGNDYNIDIKTGYLNSYDTKDGLMICTDDEYNDYKLMEKVKQKYEDKVCFVSTVDEYNDMIQKEFEKAKDEQDYLVIDIQE